MVVVFICVGFDVIDVYMSDVLVGCIIFEQFVGLVVCGGFFYGDVLGVGEGWVKFILFNSIVCDQFEGFFNCNDMFSLGVCNGCQMLLNFKLLILGIEYWLYFVINQLV